MTPSQTVSTQKNMRIDVQFFMTSSISVVMKTHVEGFLDFYTCCTDGRTDGESILNRRSFANAPH